MRTEKADRPKRKGPGRPEKKPGAQSGIRSGGRDAASEDGVAEMDRGVMLTKSEILDFSAGADS